MRVAAVIVGDSELHRLDALEVVRVGNAQATRDVFGLTAGHLGERVDGGTDQVDRYDVGIVRHVLRHLPAHAVVDERVEHDQVHIAETLAMVLHVLFEKVLNLFEGAHARNGLDARVLKAELSRCRTSQRLRRHADGVADDVHGRKILRTRSQRRKLHGAPFKLRRAGPPGPALRFVVSETPCHHPRNASGVAA